MSGRPVSAASLAVSVVTPEGEVWSGRASAVTVPTADGYVGILPRRQPLGAVLGTGTVRITTLAGTTETCVVTGGFVVVDEGEVTVMADRYAAADDA